MGVQSCKSGHGSAKISHSQSSAPPLLKSYLHPCRWCPIVSSHQLTWSLSLVPRLLCGNKATEDFAKPQDDIEVGNWTCTKHLTLNRDKCKYMIVSCRKTVSSHHHHFCLKAILWNRWKCSIIQVFSYHMISLGMNLFSQSKARDPWPSLEKIAPGSAVLQLYISLVRPHLNYASGEVEYIHIYTYNSYIETDGLFLTTVFTLVAWLILVSEANCKEQPER